MFRSRQFRLRLGRADWWFARIIANHDDFHIDVRDFLKGAPILDARGDLIGSRGTGVFEITAVNDVRAVGETSGWADEGEARAHVRSGAERNMASVFRRIQSAIGEFVGGVIGIEENIGQPEIAGDDAVAFFDRGAVKKKGRHPFPRIGIGLPKIDKRLRETIVPHRVAPCFLPTHLQGSAAIEIGNWERNEALDQIRIEHGGESRRKKVLAEDCVRFVFELE